MPADFPPQIASLASSQTQTGVDLLFSRLKEKLRSQRKTLADKTKSWYIIVNVSSLPGFVSRCELMYRTSRFFSTNDSETARRHCHGREKLRTRLGRTSALERENLWKPCGWRTEKKLPRKTCSQYFLQRIRQSTNEARAQRTHCERNRSVSLDRRVRM